MREPTDSEQINRRAPLQLRLSPDGLNVAIRNRDSKTHPWRVSNGGYYRDDQVEGWYPLFSVPPEHRAAMAEALEFRIDQATPGEDVTALQRLADYFGGER
jgi:hypothetical protein